MLTEWEAHSPFNPIKVLFLHQYSGINHLKSYSFQSYQGSIFTLQDPNLQVLETSFNPIKVLFLQKEE